jgi:hypothetical protein
MPVAHELPSGAQLLPSTVGSTGDQQAPQRAADAIMDVRGPRRARRNTAKRHLGVQQDRAADLPRPVVPLTRRHEVCPVAREPARFAHDLGVSHRADDLDRPLDLPRPVLGDGVAVGLRLSLLGRCHGCRRSRGQREQHAQRELVCMAQHRPSCSVVAGLAPASYRQTNGGGPDRPRQLAPGGQRLHDPAALVGRQLPGAGDRAGRRPRVSHGPRRRGGPLCITLGTSPGAR